MEIFLFFTIWLWIDFILNFLSKSYRRTSIKLLEKYDKDAETYWYSIWSNIHKSLKNIWNSFTKR